MHKEEVVAAVSQFSQSSRLCNTSHQYHRCGVSAVSVGMCCLSLTEVDTMRKVEVVEAEEPDTARSHYRLEAV